MTHLMKIFSALTVFLIAASFAQAKEKPVELQVGDMAPQFAGLSDQNEEWNSKDHQGKKIYVVYFYPADMTPGCTIQACSYRDAVAGLERDDVEVIGISGDAVENHQHFKNEYQLNFTLLADPDGKIAKAFGVKTGSGGSIERKIQGKKITLERGVTAKRWTFVIDKNWKIAHKDTKVNALKDSETVLKVVEGLK